MIQLFLRLYKCTDEYDIDEMLEYIDPNNTLEAPQSLYRGAQLDKEVVLKHYNVQNNQYFSWNSFVSTSLDPRIAHNFAMNANRNISPDKI